MWSLLSLVLAATGPVHVLAVHVPNPDPHVAEWQRLARPAKVVRLSELHEYLLRPSNLMGAQDGAERIVHVVGTSWVPSTTEERVVQKAIAPEHVGKLVNEVLATLASGGGDLRAREVVDELAKATEGDPFQGEEKVLTPPVKLKKSCPELPTKLEFARKGVLEEVLAARWGPEGATGAAAACKVSSSTHEEAVMGEVRMRILTMTLDCGGQAVRAEMGFEPALKRKTELASEKLLQTFAARRCR